MTRRGEALRGDLSEIKEDIARSMVGQMHEAPSIRALNRLFEKLEVTGIRDCTENGSFDEEERYRNHIAERYGIYGHHFAVLETARLGDHAFLAIGQYEAEESASDLYQLIAVSARMQSRDFEEMEILKNIIEKIMEEDNDHFRLDRRGTQATPNNWVFRYEQPINHGFLQLWSVVPDILKIPSLYRGFVAYQQERDRKVEGIAERILAGL